MAIIYSYPLNDDIKLLDELVGTTEKNINGQLKTVTRNFLLADLAEFFIIDGGIQKTITLTTNGISGPSTLNQVTGVLNIPQYIGGAGTGVTDVTASSPITSTGGNTPDISTSMTTGKLIGRWSTGTGVMQEITIGTGLTLSALGVLTSAGVAAQNLQSVTNEGSTTTNSITANSFIKQDGTSSQILAANGSVITAGSNITISGGTISSSGGGGGSVTAVTATSPITSSGGTAPVISTLMNTNKLIGRTTASTGVMEEITVGSGLALNSGTLTNTATPTPLGYYGAFQDLLTQTITTINVGQPFLIRTVDESNQVSITANGSGQLTRITPANAGTYNIQWSGQFQNPNNAIHDVNVWFRKGLTSSSGPGTDIPGSNGKIALPARKSASAGEEGHIVVGWNFVLTIAAGEYVEFYWMSDNALITLQAYPGALPPPSTASLIVTVTQQSGIMAGTGITGLGVSGSAQTGATQTLATGESGTNFGITSSGNIQAFNLPVASETNTGKLSSTNWSTFNSKAGSGANTDITSVALTTGTISTAPSALTDIVNKSYVDTIATGINFHQACSYATAAVLPAYTYANGPTPATPGIGATITGNSNGALVVDGVTVTVTTPRKRVLIKNELAGNAAYNGVYTVERVGNVSTTYQLTRATDYDTVGTGTNEIDQGDMVLVLTGTVNTNTSWVQQNTITTVGTDPITFVQFAAVQTYTAGTGLSLSGTNAFSITNTGVSNATYGSATASPQIAINLQGQITSASNVTITPAVGNITGLGANVATFLATPSSANLALAVTGETGTGGLVFADTPTLITPVLGVATATSINKIQLAINGTYTTDALLSIASNKTITFSNSVTFSGTDAANVAFGSGGTIAYTSNTLGAFAPTTSASLASVISDETGWSAGSGSLVFSNGPTLTTPILGAATATSINKVTITQPLTSATLTIANAKSLTANSILTLAGVDSKTLTINNTLTLGGTDNSTIAFGTGGTVAYTGSGLNQFASTTSAQLAGVISDETGTGLLVFATTPSLTTPILGVATATSINKLAITAPTTGATLTVADGKTLRADNSLTFTGTDLASANFGTGGTVAYTSTRLFESTTTGALAGSTFNYCGIASGSSANPASTIWTIRRITITSAGVATTQTSTTNPGIWNSRASYTYA